MTSNAQLNVEALQTTLRGISFVTVHGPNGVDDTTAIKAAVATGKNVYLPAGTWFISAWANLQSNTTFFGEGAQTILKVKSGTYVSGQQVFNVAGKDSVIIRDLVIDGNKGNIGSTHLPIVTVFNSTNVTVENVRFQLCEGICLNVSTDCHDFTAQLCRFVTCGGNRDNSDGYRNQGIAFSNSSGHSALRAKILFNTFFAQGLDSISLSRVMGGEIIGNIGDSSYTLVYNGSGSPSFDLVVANNIARNVSSVGGPNNPNAFDLSQVNGLVFTGNLADTVDAVGAGIFAGCNNVTATGNTFVNTCQNVASWNGAICVGGSGSASNVSNVKIANNTVADTNGTALMPYGIVIANDIVNLDVGQNSIYNPLTSKYGKFVATSGVTGHVTALTDNTGISSTTYVQDLDTASGVQTFYRAINSKVGYQVNGVQVLGAQITGYGTPTGASRTANFNGASATLAQTSAQLAQVILDLKAGGPFGV